MLGSLPSQQKHHGSAVLSRKAMFETLLRHLDMIRLSAAGVLMVSLIGCTGLISGGGTTGGGGDDGPSQQQQDAATKWKSEALPVLKQNCVACHNGSRASIDFLAGADDTAIHDKVLKFDPAVVNLEAATSSRLITKGQHDGPPFTAEQSAAVLGWIQAERESATHDPANPVVQLATTEMAVQLCTSGLPDNTAGTCPTNHLSLATVPTVGATVPGAEISFTAQSLVSGLYLTNLKVSGGTAGVYLEHLLFVSRPTKGDPFPDQIDRYFATKLNVMANGSSPLGGGTEQFGGFAATDKVEVHFKTLSAFKPDTTPPAAGGCKVLDKFKANAVAPLQQSCASCHAGGNGTSAMDITGINSTTDTTLATVCAQVRSRINLTNTDQSGFYLAPDPASQTNHPFKFNPATGFTTFKASLDVWVKAEQTAP